jgi:hypothetical protein
MNRRNNPLDLRAAVYAGIVAGALATLVQMALWSIFTDALPAILFRDGRFAAALLLGRGVLPPPASFDAWVMLVATFVHFALSIAYGLMLAPLIARLSTRLSLLAGTAFGLGLYIVNLDGFTAIFPWFEESRDWIAMVAHVAFGLFAAGTYRLLLQRRFARTSRNR